MAHDQIVSEWIVKADEDYLFARKHLQDEDSFFAPLCFHAHQAAEKYFKAYIVARGLSLRKVHDLIELVGICQSQDASFEKVRSDATLLQRYYVDTRYPTVWPVGTQKSDAQEAIEAAGRVREILLEKLGKKA